MLCVHCHMTRPYDWNACPHCGATSPLYDRSQAASMQQAASQWPWEGQETQAPAQQQQVQSGPLTPPEIPQMAMVPVPYQPWQQGMHPTMQTPGTALQPAQEDIMVQMPQNRDAMLPALPNQFDNEPIVFVPPMYTKPRPVIPRYRIISGLLSVLIVGLLTCTGAGYYAKATGKLQYLQRVVGGAAPASLAPTAAPNLADPQMQPMTGPAYVVITSAVMTAHTDPTNPYFAKEPENKFVVSHLIHLIYSVQKPATAGVVKTVWYTNNLYYGSVLSKMIVAGATQTGDSQVKYMQPCEGKVELYWNNQLAWTLFFVVRP